MANRPRGGASIEAVEDPALIPTCPHCKASLSRVLTRRLDVRGSSEAKFGKRYLYACPSCNAVLGFSHRKGFWMG